MTNRGLIVLVEGLPGSGKTTTSEQIAATYVQHGESCECVGELAEHHPVLGRAVRRLHGRSDYDEICLAQWANFIERVGERPRVVLDGCAMQSTVRFMFEDGWPIARIESYWQRFEQSFRRVPVAFVYLAHPNPAVFIREQMATTRVDVWAKIARHVEQTPAGQALMKVGTDPTIGFWAQYRRLCDGLVARTTLPLLRCDIGHGWQNVAPKVHRWLNGIESRPTS
jgi:hypothetical protein